MAQAALFGGEFQKLHGAVGTVNPCAVASAIGCQHHLMKSIVGNSPMIRQFSSDQIHVEEVVIRNGVAKCPAPLRIHEQGLRIEERR